MRVLVFSSLYPSSAAPNFGVFVHNRTSRLARAEGVEIKVVAPVFRGLWPLSAARTTTQPPSLETLDGLEVHHPVVIHVPGVWQLNPSALVRSCLPMMNRLKAAWSFDVIDAHYFYPDGVAAMRLARSLGVPFVCTARGSDITYWPSRFPAGRWVREVGERAAGLAGVSASLVRDMVALGMPEHKMQVLRNGVDLERFKPLPDRAQLRAQWGMHRFTAVSVGSLIPRKCHEVTIRALARLPDVDLVIAGEGPERERLMALSRELGLQARVRLLGSVPHDQLVGLYNAADVSVLASFHEGLANALLEAIACGVPLIATNVDGAPEVLDDPRAGVMVPVGDAGAIARALHAMRLSAPSRAEVRASAERFDWAATTDAQKAQLLGAMQEHRRI